VRRVGGGIWQACCGMAGSLVAWQHAGMPARRERAARSRTKAQPREMMAGARGGERSGGGSVRQQVG